MCCNGVKCFKTHQSIHSVFTEHGCEGIIEVPKGQTSSQLKVDLKTVTDEIVIKSGMNLFQVSFAGQNVKFNGWLIHSRYMCMYRLIFDIRPLTR